MDKIKLIVMDFDGVFTNGKCYFDNNNIKKFYNVKDGMALIIAKNNNIRVAVISNYNSNKSVLWNETNIDKAIIEHLNFDYYYVGKENKLNVLNKWIRELNINYDNIAYIGDDINDIPIMKLVGFSSCPSDAVQECKNIVDYVCNKSGGNGCVREFIDKIINDGEQYIIQEIKKEFNYQIDNIDIDKIHKLIDVMNQKNTIYFTGIGKSETVAFHCSSLLKSVNINAHFINAVNALHGDIGTMNSNDMIFLFSKSGNTIELINLIPFIQKKGSYIVGVCCDGNNKFSEYCNLVIQLPFNKEISGSIDKIPTNSFMSQVLFCNILVSIIKKNITIEQYKDNHPSGNIGDNLKKIKDCLLSKYPKILFTDEVQLVDVLFEMTKHKCGCCFFVNDIDELIGILTDGDIRRLISKNGNKQMITTNDINKNYYYEENLNKFVCECKKYNYFPILEHNKLIGVANLWQ